MVVDIDEGKIYVVLIKKRIVDEMVVRDKFEEIFRR